MLKSRTRSEKGAALVEMAVVMPLFILLLFGIMEAGWAFSQQVEVRNAAREGARLAVVDYPTPGSGDSTAIVAEVCSRAPLSADRALVSVEAFDTNGDGDYDLARITVSQDYASLTGVIPAFGSLTITSTVEMRVERDTVTWSDITSVVPNCP
jgi:Flp pilus assembly protein TadG